MPKLFVSDIDGTLLPRGESTLSQNICKMLEFLISTGVVTAIASGRSYDSIKDIFPHGEIPRGLYVISNDGALCTHNSAPLYHKPFSGDSLEKMYAATKASGAGFFCLSDKSLIYGHSDILENCGAFSVSRGQRIDRIARCENVYKIGIVDEKGIGKGFAALPGDVRCAYDDGFLREYVSKYADKSTAIADLQVRTFAHHEDTFVCGDGINDVCMAQKAKFCASVGNCSPQMRECSNLHFESGEQTLDYYIKTFV